MKPPRRRRDAAAISSPPAQVTSTRASGTSTSRTSFRSSVPGDEGAVRAAGLRVARRRARGLDARGVRGLGAWEFDRVLSRGPPRIRESSDSTRGISSTGPSTTRRRARPLNSAAARPGPFRCRGCLTRSWSWGRRCGGTRRGGLRSSGSARKFGNVARRRTPWGVEPRALRVAPIA